MGKSTIIGKTVSRAFLTGGMLVFVLLCTACGKEEETVESSVVSIKEIPTQIEEVEEEVIPDIYAEEVETENVVTSVEENKTEEYKEPEYEPVDEPDWILETPTENKYTRLKEGYIGKYVAGTSNGYIFPFEISTANISDSFMDGERKARIGFVDETGMIVSDYGYRFLNERKSDDYWIVYDDDNCYYIAKNGESVLCINLLIRFAGARNIIQSKNYVFTIEQTWSDKPYFFETVNLEKYDYSGILLDKKEYYFHIKGEDYGYNSGGCEDIYNDRFLLIKLLKDDGIYSYIFDMEINEFILIEKAESLIFCENNTFIVSYQDEEKTEYVLYDVNGNRFGNYSYRHLEYLNDDFYYAVDGDCVEKIITLSEKGLTEVHRFSQTDNECEEHFGKGFFALSNDSVNWETFDFYGNPLEPNVNAEADAFKNASRYGICRYIWSDWKQLDTATKDSSYPIYYGKETTSDGGYIVLRLNTDESILYTIQPEDYQGYLRGYFSVIDGLFSDNHKLVDLDTKEVIFYYKPLYWDNTD